MSRILYRLIAALALWVPETPPCPLTSRNPRRSPAPDRSRVLRPTYEIGLGKPEKPLPVFVVVGLLNNPDTALNDLAAADLINNVIDLT